MTGETKSMIFSTEASWKSGDILTYREDDDGYPFESDPENTLPVCADTPLLTSARNSLKKPYGIIAAILFLSASSASVLLEHIPGAILTTFSVLVLIFAILGVSGAKEKHTIIKTRRLNVLAVVMLIAALCTTFVSAYLAIKHTGQINFDFYYIAVGLVFAVSLIAIAAGLFCIRHTVRNNIPKAAMCTVSATVLFFMGIIVFALAAVVILRMDGTLFIPDLLIKDNQRYIITGCLIAYGVSVLLSAVRFASFHLSVKKVKNAVRE
jgi:hypothetical protein